jgi:hypothetical protein
MKNIILVLAFVPSLLSCQSKSVDKKDDFIQYKETIILNDVPRSTLTFFDVSDSRCPVGGVCIWAGNVKVDLALEGVTTEGKVTKKISLYLGASLGDTTGSAPYKLVDSLDQNFAGIKYRFILDGIRPENRGEQTKPEYAISLRVKKL